MRNRPRCSSDNPDCSGLMYTEECQHPGCQSTFTRCEHHGGTKTLNDAIYGHNKRYHTASLDAEITELVSEAQKSGAPCPTPAQASSSEKRVHCVRYNDCLTIAGRRRPGHPNGWSQFSCEHCTQYLADWLGQGFERVQKGEDQSSVAQQLAPMLAKTPAPFERDQESPAGLDDLVEGVAAPENTDDEDADLVDEVQEESASPSDDLASRGVDKSFEKHHV